MRGVLYLSVAMSEMKSSVDDSLSKVRQFYTSRRMASIRKRKHGTMPTPMHGLVSVADAAAAAGSMLKLDVAIKVYKEHGGRIH
jgi:hypothetical protein